MSANSEFEFGKPVAATSFRISRTHSVEPTTEMFGDETAAKKGGKMRRNINCFACLLVALIILGFGRAICYADSFTMDFTGVGPGLNTNGVYTYPYNFTITPTGGGQSFDASLMCISYNREITIPETWTANRTTAGALGKTYEEAAYLWSVAAANLQTNPTEVIDANWAAWSLFSGPAAYDQNQKDLLDEAAKVYSQYGGVYVWLADPLNDSGWTDGEPQDFVGLTPEPATWALLGSGLIGFIAMLYFRKRSETHPGQLRP